MQQSLLQFFNQTELKKYVKSTHFEGQFMPYSTLPFLMHWSDHAKVTKALRHEIRHNEKSHEDYNKIVEGLKKLKNSPLWLRLEGKIIQLSVYDLYHNLFITKNFSHEKEYGVSFIGPYGPFTTTKLFDCLNFHTYKNFIYCLSNKIKLIKLKILVMSTVFYNFQILYNNIITIYFIIYKFLN